MPKIDDYYKKSNVSDIMDRIIGPLKRQNYFIGQSFIARGHLAAKTDFPFVAQQIATFYHLNVFPQFQAFNNLNWRALEESIRDHDFGNAVFTYTEVEDVLQLPNATNINQPLYLIGNYQFPIPQRVYKHIITPDHIFKFVGFNHPNINTNEFNHFYNYCPDQCNDNNHTWLKNSLRNVNNRMDSSRGIFLCCNI